MKRISILIGALLWAAPVFAQEQGMKLGDLQRIEFTLNPYSYIQVDRISFHGAGAGLAYHLSNGIAITGDFSLNKSSDDEELFSFRGGPRFTRRSGKASVFGQILVGGFHVRQPFDVTRHGWAGGAGAGIDIRSTDYFTFRVIQAEYFPIYVQDVGNIFHGARITTGFVFHIP